MPKSNFFILDKYKLVSMGIPKCGQTSIKRAFLGNVYNVHDKQALDYIPLEFMGTMVRDLKSHGYTTFTFVRNPYDRVASFWKQKIATPNKFTDFSKQFDHGMTFEETIDRILEIPEDICNIHFRSQVRQITVNDELPDFIGRLETMKEDWLELQEAIGKELPSLPWENRTDAKEEDIWTEELKEKVYIRYQDDFETLGYRA